MPPYRKSLLPPFPQSRCQGLVVASPPSDTAHLWKEANKALGELLSIKSSIDAHQQKLVWEVGMALLQNDSETVESIKEAKALCTCSIQEAESCCSIAIRKAEPKGPPRLALFNNHTTKPFSTLKRNLLKRRERVNSTSFPSVRLPCKPANWNSATCWWLPTTFCWDMHQCPISLAFPKELPYFHQSPPP